MWDRFEIEVFSRKNYVPYVPTNDFYADFDRIVSCIEDIVVGDDFQEMQARREIK